MRSRLRELACPRCGIWGNLHGHGQRLGCAESASGRVLRGARVLCSNRHRLRGCGRTFTILLGGCVHGHTVSTQRLWAFLRELAGGTGVLAAWERIGSAFSLESAYRWRRRLRLSQGEVRVCLCRVRAPPKVEKGEPLAEVGAHLVTALGEDENNPIAAFQIHFQRNWPMASSPAGSFSICS